MSEAIRDEIAHIARRRMAQRVSRYEIRCNQDGCLVFDLQADEAVTRRMPWAKASRLCLEMNHA